MRWTSKSGAKLAAALREMGHDVVERTVSRLLKAKGYSLQANQKTREGASHPDRDAQFQHISETVTNAIAAGEPVISEVVTATDASIYAWAKTSCTLTSSTVTDIAALRT